MKYKFLLLPKAFILISIIFFFACKNDKIEVIQENSRSGEDVENYKQASKKKFAYAKFLVKSPVLKQKEAFNYDLGDFQTEHYVEWEDDIYITDVLPIENYNSDSEYIFIDNMEKVVAQKIAYRDMNFRGDLTVKVRYVNEIEKLEHNKSKIVDSKFLSFDSYEKASISRRNNENKF